MTGAPPRHLLPRRRSRSLESIAPSEARGGGATRREELSIFIIYFCILASAHLKKQRQVLDKGFQNSLSLIALLLACYSDGHFNKLKRNLKLCRLCPNYRSAATYNEKFCYM